MAVRSKENPEGRERRLDLYRLFFFHHDKISSFPLFHFRPFLITLSPLSHHDDAVSTNQSINPDSTTEICAWSSIVLHVPRLRGLLSLLMKRSASTLLCPLSPAPRSLPILPLLARFATNSRLSCLRPISITKTSGCSISPTTDLDSGGRYHCGVLFAQTLTWIDSFCRRSPPQ